MFLVAASPLLLAAVVVVLLAILVNSIFSSKKDGNGQKTCLWPPGPSRLKSLLNLRMVNNTDLMNMLDKWPDKYGEVMSIWFGRQRCVLLNSSQAVQESLLKYYDDFSGREPIELKWHSGILTNEGSQCMKNRKQTIRLLYKYGMNMRQLEYGIGEEINSLFQLWDRLENKPFEPRTMFRTFSFNINAHAICSEHTPYAFQENCLGQQPVTTTDKPAAKFVRICQLSKEVNTLLNEGIYAHWFPLRKWLPAYARHKRRMLIARREMFEAVRDIVRSHKETLNVDEPRDLVDHYCIDIARAPESQQEETERNSVETITDVIIASVETFPSVVHWLVYFLIKNQHVQQKIFAEICQVFSDDGVEEGEFDLINGVSDKLDRYANLHYTRAAIAEGMRCSNMFNVIVSHVAVRDTKVLHYDIPAGTPCILNIHHINYSEKEFDKPEMYRPERFLDPASGRYLKPKNFFFFGAGARACIGEDFAFKELMFFVAHVVSRYELLAAPGYVMPSHLEPISQGNFVCRDYNMTVRRRRLLKL